MRILMMNNALRIGGAAALFAGCAGSQLPAATSPSSAHSNFTHHRTFRYTGKEQTFKVPSGVTRIQVVAVGASGGGKFSAHGGRVSAVIPVAQSEMLVIYVGATGASSGGGFNGGGAGGESYGTYRGYGAGGASDVRQGGDARKDRIIVAGGGGGQGGAGGGSGGQGGARTGGSGKRGCCSVGGGGGTGGTQQHGGIGGAGLGEPGGNGNRGDGGAGGTGCDSATCGYPGGGGGGGGGGYYGGGGGGGGIFDASKCVCGGGGGGGGSSYVENTASNVHLWRGWKTATGNGLVVFSW